MTSTTATAVDTSVRRTTRIHALDALRAGALLLGIVLHSLLPFVPYVTWLVSDSQSSELAGVPVMVIHLFRMSLFMLLAGFVGRMVTQRRGTGRYLRDRTVRILLPLVVLWPVVVLPIGLLVMLNADVNDVPLPVPPQPAEGSFLAISPGHLWFLLVLFECVVILLAGRALLRAALGPERCTRALARVGGVLAGPAGLPLAAIPYAAGVLLQGDAVGAIREPHSLVPSPSALTAYLGCVVVGWALHAAPGSMTRIARRWPWYLGSAAVLTVVSLLISDPAAPPPLLVSAVVLALAGWSWVFGLVGVCVRFLSAERPWVRYLADASYWMFLVHLPLLLAFEILLVRQPWPIPVKLALTWVVVGAVMLVSYHLLVRSTPVGRWLNGRRHPFRLPGLR